MERLDTAVQRELGRFEPVESELAAVVRVWPQAVGETIAKNAWPARLARDGTLHVATVSATWAFELGRLAETIQAQVAAALGRSPALAFAPGPVPEGRAAPPRQEQVPAESSAADRAQATALVAEIGDDELRALVARAAAASLASGRRRAAADRRF